jgi:hypothetical protein
LAPEITKITFIGAKITKITFIGAKITKITFIGPEVYLKMQKNIKNYIYWRRKYN